jgi:hypothetical protein
VIKGPGKADVFNVSRGVVQLVQVNSSCILKLEKVCKKFPKELEKHGPLGPTPLEIGVVN